MELNFYKIFQVLEPYRAEQKINTANSQLKSCELLETAFAPYWKETLYIAQTPEEIHKLPNEAGYCVVCNYPNREMFDYPELIGVRDKYNFIFLEHSLKIEELYTLVKKRIGDYYSMIQLSEDLFQAINSNAGIQRLVDLLFSCIGNSVYVFDTGYQLLARKEGPNCSPPQLDEIGGKLYVADFDIQKVNFMHNHERMKTERKPIWVQNANIGPDRITCMIDYDRDIGHFVIVEDGVPFDANVYEYVALFQRALHLYFYNDPFSQNVKGFHYEYYLKDLLSQKYAGYAGKNTRTKYLDATFSENLFCLVIETAKTPEGVRFVSVRGQLEAMLPYAVTVVYESQIVIVISGYPKYRLEKELQKKVRDFCLGNNLYCGMSNAFTNILKLHQYYKQALRAMEMETKYDGHGGLFIYEELYLAHVENIFSSIEDVEIFCCPQMKALFEYDEQNETELAKTLYYFLICGNTKDAAAHLFVHRNTILYRIRLINDLIGEDYQELSLRRYLVTSYEMVRKPIL